MRIKNNCRKATLLVEKGLSGRIIFAEKVELRMHLAGCAACRLYQQQSRSINNLAWQLLHDTEEKSIVLDNFFKDKLEKTIMTRIEKQDDSNMQ
jgi:hypothetical protein